MNSLNLNRDMELPSVDVDLKLGYCWKIVNDQVYYSFAKYFPEDTLSESIDNRYDDYLVEVGEYTIIKVCGCGVLIFESKLRYD